MTLTQHRLKELLHYAPRTGHFTWRVKRGNIPAGRRAGCLDGKGYIVIGVDGKEYRAHRLAFMYMAGGFPVADVDHINRITHDNRWSNLRAASRSQNLGNTKRRKDNTSGHRGVTWDARAGTWYARGWANGKHVDLGHYKELADAGAAASAWRAKKYGEFAA